MASLAAGRHGKFWAAGGVLACAAWLIIAQAAVVGRFARAPRSMSRPEAEAVWRWIDQVGADDGIVATYEVTAPLSSRQSLYSYIMDANKPRGFPFQLAPTIRWVFFRQGTLDTQIFLKQGFVVVHSGQFLQILRR